MSAPAVLKTIDVCRQMGLARTTLHDWLRSDAKLAGCIIRRTKHSTYWSVQRLQDRGFLTKPDVSAPVMSFEYRVAQ